MITLHIGQQGGLKCGIDQLVYTKRAKQGIGSHASNEFAVPAEDSRLWPTQQLIPTVTDHIHASLEAIERPRFATHPEGT